MLILHYILLLLIFFCWLSIIRLVGVIAVFMLLCYGLIPFSFLYPSISVCLIYRFGCVYEYSEYYPAYMVTRDC